MTSRMMSVHKDEREREREKEPISRLIFLRMIA